MKKITIISTEEVVATIDYSKFETWRVGEPIQTTDKIIARVKKVVDLPKYHKCFVDLNKKIITFVVYTDNILLENAK